MPHTVSDHNLCTSGRRRRRHFTPSSDKLGGRPTGSRRTQSIHAHTLSRTHTHTHEMLLVGSSVAHGEKGRFQAAWYVFSEDQVYVVMTPGINETRSIRNRGGEGTSRSTPVKDRNWPKLHAVSYNTFLASRGLRLQWLWHILMETTANASWLFKQRKSLQERHFRTFRWYPLLY